LIWIGHIATKMNSAQLHVRDSAREKCENLSKKEHRLFPFKTIIEAMIEFYDLSN